MRFPNPKPFSNLGTLIPIPIIIVKTYTPLTLRTLSPKPFKPVRRLREAVGAVPLPMEASRS